MRIARIIVAVTASLILGSGPAGNATAQDVEPRDPEIPGELFFVLGNLEYILLHELAHMLINDLEIPIIGSEESAADYLATSVLIRADRFDPARADRARNFLFATANGLASAWDFNASAGVDVQYWDSHALTIQRFYQIVCLIYGSDPVRYAEVPSQVGMPAPRAARCPTEYERADRSMQWLLDNYGRHEGDPENAPIELVFEPAPSRVSQRVVDAIRSSDMLDNTIRRLNERFKIPVSFRIAFRRCDEAQARWLPDAREISVCYRLIDSYYALGLSSQSDRALFR
jgi:hypothetical protein